MFKKNARIASASDLNNWSKNKESMKASGLQLIREQGNWILVNLKEQVTEKFWKAWRTDKAALKEKGYRVTYSYGMWIVY